MTERGVSIDTLRRMYRDFARRRPVPAQEPEDGDKPTDEVQQAELFDRGELD